MQPADPRSEAPYRLTASTAARIALLGMVAVAAFAVLFFRLWSLQVLSGDRYARRADANQVRHFRVQAPRGTIIDRDGEVLVANAPGTAVQLWLTDLPKDPVKLTGLLRRLEDLLSLDPREIRRAIRDHHNDQLTPITIRTDVKPAKAEYLLERRDQFPGVSVATVQLRRYEQGTLASQVLGYVGEISAEELKERGSGYRAGDRIGKTGIEAAYDRYLRGQAGEGQVRVDATGAVTGPRELSVVPKAGNTVRLTIDAGVQRAAEQALRDAIAAARANGAWAANGGAIVAMDPRTGEIRALASNPPLDPRIYVGRVDAKQLAKLADPAANHPSLNRAVDGIYPPGSTFKPVTALAALEEGVLSPDELIQCSPQLIVDGQTFRNWTYANEPMTLRTALAASCDTYFYDIGLRFYRLPERRGSPLQRWAREMGFGRKTGIDVGPEASGLLPTPAWRRRTFTNPVDRLWKSGDSVQLAIGQKDMLVTPLQMTRFYALIANGGKLVWPHVVASVEQPGNGRPPIVLRRNARKPPIEVPLDPAAIRIVQEGLYDATHASYGTSSAVFSSFPVPIAGKTGTAEKFVALPGFKGKMSQAWWCGYGPYAEPELAVCVVVENGGFGGEIAAPAALRVFEAYFGVQGQIVGPVNSD